MDEEDTAGFRQPCAQCSAVDWGVSDEGRFYCRSCHNIIERTKEVVDPTVTPGSTRISSISRGGRHRRETGRQWMVCEGFQFILRNQADALLRLGVSPLFKDQVLCPMWRLYLQRSGQAYTLTPVRSSQFRVRGLDSESDTGAEASASEVDRDTNASSTFGSQADSSSEWSACSGSLDASSYLSRGRGQGSGRGQGRGRGLMSMRKTLALLHLALLWSRQPLTLSDLLRLVNEGHVPYLNAHDELPEEMLLYGRDALIFRVQSVPSQRAVQAEAQALALFLQLPPFPPVARRSPLHPAALARRYLTDANLPDELHPWVCRLMERTGADDQALLTFDPGAHPALPQPDLQAAALVIVTLKVLFGLDDHTEWVLSSEASEQDDRGGVFSLRRWYRLTQAALLRAQQRTQRDVCRKQWKPKKKLLYSSRKRKCVFLKRKRTAEQVQMCFEKLSSRPAGAGARGPSSFRFCWGDGDGADGPGLTHQSLDPVLTLRDGELRPVNTSYWHPALKPCNPRTCKQSHFSEVEPTLPRSFVWVLRLFCFLLDVPPERLYEEVLRLERRLLGCRAAGTETGTTAKTRTRTRTRTRAETGTPQRRRQTREGGEET